MVSLMASAEKANVMKRENISSVDLLQTKSIMHKSCIKCIAFSH